jgi:quercetin dioxygenase-like cupin family protein
MKSGFALLSVLLLLAAALFAQDKGGATSGGAVVANAADLKWESDAKDKSESAVLREDPATGAFEMFVRYPAGHVFAPHWHSANERIVLLEGQMAIGEGGEKKFLEAGGFAYLPARQVQHLSCVSSTACRFYVYWDGKLDFHRAGEGADQKKVAAIRNNLATRHDGPRILATAPPRVLTCVCPLGVSL